MPGGRPAARSSARHGIGLPGPMQPELDGWVEPFVLALRFTCDDPVSLGAPMSGPRSMSVTRTGGTTRPTTVHFAHGGRRRGQRHVVGKPGSSSPGADYRKIVDGSLTFNPGETSRTFAVQLCVDSVVESLDPETLTLRLLSVSAPATMGAQSRRCCGSRTTMELARSDSVACGSRARCTT